MAGALSTPGRVQTTRIRLLPSSIPGIIDLMPCESTKGFTKPVPRERGTGFSFLQLFLPTINRLTPIHLYQYLLLHARYCLLNNLLGSA